MRPRKVETALSWALMPAPSTQKTTLGLISKMRMYFKFKNFTDEKADTSQASVTHV
jgi:hypothetical protein